MANLTKAGWIKRIEEIQKQFPSTVQLDWREAMDNDIDLFGRIIRDLLKLDQAPPGRSGPRPVLEQKTALVKLRQFMRTDFTELEFREAIQSLSGGESHRVLAARTGINRGMMQRLLSGERYPDIGTIELVAQAFDKHPSYFLEYRIAYIFGAVAQVMNESPEVSIDLYRRLNPRV